MIFRREPVLIQTLVLAVLNVLVVFNVVSFTDEQLAAINGLIAAILGAITRQIVTPLVRPRDKQGRDLVPKPGQ
jgi:hypothetical protein